ncbi:MAG TPA: TMEM175 family protein [Rhodanobacteraceae bacterium]|nr:TMEM175 family protein [Rhodanobacteraceae bacterium]
MAEAGAPTEREKRRERTESARLDNFVDGAFAFAVTLLVISGASLPKNVAALEHALRGVPAFAACFVQLAVFWHGHVRWRDVTRLTDGTSRHLSLLLVFFALIFVFPLHLVYAIFFGGITGGALSPDFAHFTTTLTALSSLFVCYGLSYACMAGTLALLFRHGIGNAVHLPREELINTRAGMVTWSFCGSVGLLSALIALLAIAIGQAWPIMVAGCSYALLWATGSVKKRYRSNLEATLPS